MQLFLFIFFVSLAYIYGSLNNGIIIGKYFHGVDVRDYGSKGAGSTNTLRTLGKKTALAVFVLDLSKPIIPVLLARLFVPQGFDIASAYGWICLGAVVGQCYPLFFGFKGGKGAATTLGTMIILFPPVVISAATIFFTLLFVKKMVSLSTIVAISATLVPVYMFYPIYFIPFLVITILIFWRHRENVKRLISGTERKLSDKKEILKNEPPK
ncbi:MAG: glycerol-3-phosphate 1-O-acyltransferase PlsY [Culicoidibacterales bacterium]